MSVVRACMVLGKLAVYLGVLECAGQIDGEPRLVAGRG